jgi:hypothetical protein
LLDATLNVCQFLSNALSISWGCNLSRERDNPTSSINLMEDEMSALKSLTFTTLPKPTVNPTLDRRTKIIARLEEQKLLLRDPTYLRTVRSTEKNEAGVKIVVEKRQRVLPWWTSTPNGSLAFFIRAGWKPIEFEKGKAAIAVPSRDKLSFVIDTLIAAVRNGELDEQLAQASAQTKPPKRKRVA